MWTIVPAQIVVVAEVDAVDQQPVVGRQLRQAFDGADVVGALRHVDVHADAVTNGQFGGSGERVVGAGEGSVHADHAPSASAQEAVVLVEPRRAPSLPWRSVTP